ncbi:D-alanyl-D-alanine carboxypeptidase family protein [uncultured Amnibacterium sp.]|uniref:M15 family metallopeptidase n=1 Tax=uncultured Amnibacterium sp. TaxID=1631851 RepID=UPI0035C98EA7
MLRPAGRAFCAAALLLMLAGCTSQQPGPGSVPSSTASSGAAGGATPASTAPTSLAPSASAGSATSLQAATTPAKPASTPKPSGFDFSARSLDDPTSLWVVVDKRRPLRPRTYVPPDLVTPQVPHTNVPQLRKVAATALVTMFAAAKRDGVTLYSLSAYRSYATQKSIFDRNLASLGRATTLNLTAKPGYSEHQTGLADDLGDGSSCDLQVCFESHRAAKWLAANSWRYGWVLRYPLGYTRITGIQTEPWHFRYIGTPAATEMHRTGVKTLEQFFGLPASPDY